MSADNLKFGLHYADHMMESDWTAESGWHRPLISPLHSFNIHPGAKVGTLHQFTRRSRAHAKCNYRTHTLPTRFPRKHARATHHLLHT